MNKLRVLVACEFSGIVRDSFLNHGHDAWSCDLLPSESSQERHIQADITSVLGERWDLCIAHPPCDHLSVSGARWFAEKRADGRQQAGIDFFMMFVTDTGHIPMVAIENPVGIMSTHYRKPNQIVNPWEYSHPETKKTCLWLKGLPLLQPTSIVEGREPRIHHMSPGPNRGKDRSRFYPGIGAAMAQQWGRINPLTGEIADDATSVESD